jgi:glycosyltransferase involved in cell wall biosynthesis
VLISAFAFSPVRGSEAAVGWNIALRLAERFDVVLLYGDVRSDKRSEKEVALYLETHSVPQGLSVEYISPSWATVLFDKLHNLPGCWMLYYTAYRCWQKRAFSKARELHAISPFHICHQLTYIGYREPGWLWRLGIPFVWGPVSGAENMPHSFYRNLRGLEFFRPLSRDIVNTIQQAFPGRIKAAAKAATKVFAVSPAEKKLFSRWGVNAECMLETGAAPNSLGCTRVRTKGPLNIVWCGLFTPRKALPILLMALTQLKDEQWQLTVVGDGASRKPWMQLAKELGFSAERIKWIGQLPREQALQVMSANDILIHTGLREGTPHVVLEALSLGLPVICHDAGGMSTAVTMGCGIKVSLVSPAVSITGFSKSIRSFFDDPDLLAKLSEGALKRSRQLTWDSISGRIGEAYISAARSIPLPPTGATALE